MKGNQYARGHPGIHVVPAVLAAGQTKKVSGQQAIVAVALGMRSVRGSAWPRSCA
jgi:2-methylcitrate dehydratase PrpD